MNEVRDHEPRLTITVEGPTALEIVRHAIDLGVTPAVLLNELVVDGLDLLRVGGPDEPEADRLFRFDLLRLLRHPVPGRPPFPEGSPLRRARRRRTR